MAAVSSNAELALEQEKAPLETWLGVSRRGEKAAGSRVLRTVNPLPPVSIYSCALVSELLQNQSL